MKSIEDLVDQMTADLEGLQKLPRRKCTMLDQFRSSPDVLGKVSVYIQIMLFINLNEKSFVYQGALPMNVYR